MGKRGGRTGDGAAKAAKTEPDSQLFKVRFFVNQFELLFVKEVHKDFFRQ